MRSRSLLIAATCALAASLGTLRCSLPAECATDNDCPAGAYCHPTQRVCFWRDGGTPPSPDASGPDATVRVDAGLQEDSGLPDSSLADAATTDSGPVDAGNNIDSGQPAQDAGMDAGLAGCDAGSHLCSGQCAATNDPNNCGPSCAACSAPGNASATCDGTNCGFLCNAGYLRCGTACCQATAVAGGGQHTCALTTAGGVKCWGDNSAGQLGIGTSTPLQSTVPLDVVGLTSGVVGIAAGMLHSCAVLSNGSVECWGDNTYGQLGTGNTVGHTAPVAVASVTNAAAVTAGDNHTCVVTVNGSAYCWGDNTFGQVGDGTTTRRLVPAAVAGPAGTDGGTDGGFAAVNGVQGGGSHTCAIDATGALYCWGENTNGQLGDGSQTMRPSPVFVSGCSSIGCAMLSVGLGAQHTCANFSYPSCGTRGCSTKYASSCWGANDVGQLGTGNTTPALLPTPVPGVNGPTNMCGLGGSHSVAAFTCESPLICSPAQIVSWGDNTYGELGDGTTQGNTSPVGLPSQVSPMSTCASGQGHVCGVIAGLLYCWGWNLSGQLASGNNTDLTVPSPIGPN